MPVAGIQLHEQAVTALQQAHRPSALPGQPDMPLFQQLVVLRKQIASELRLPPYIIFHDSTLHEMCKHYPTDIEAMSGISGVGEAKLQKYGGRFAELIHRHVEEHGEEGA